MKKINVRNPFKEDRKEYSDYSYLPVQLPIEKVINPAFSDLNGFTGDNIKTRGKSLINFSLCDYLALGSDDRIKPAIIQALNDQNSFGSEINNNIKLYDQASEFLSRIFEKPAFLFSRSTLAHMAVLPLISNNGDAVILDQYVHTNIHIAADLLKSYGKFTKTIRHNKMDILEEEIKKLKNKYKSIWYLSDGIHSIFGDKIPVNELYRLLEEYEQLNVYIDDSHGISWTGKNGKGFVNECLNGHPRVLVASSLSKGFGVDGGSVICTNNEMKNKLIEFADPLIKKTPINPSILNAIIESSKIHLSDEIYSKQTNLKENIDAFYLTAKDLDLPLISHADTPIAFFLTGKVNISQEICFNLMKQGYYLNALQFPAVPLNRSGLRAYISLHQTKSDIKGMLKAMKVEFDKASKKYHFSVSDMFDQLEEKQEEYYTFREK